MKINMSLRNGSFSEQTTPGHQEQDVVIVKMNMPRRFKFAPGTQPQIQGDLNTTKRPLNVNLISGKQDKDEVSPNCVQDEFATVTVNLLSSRPKQLDDESEDSKDDEDEQKLHKLSDPEMQGSDDSSEEEENIEAEEYETDSEDSDKESKSARRTKTPSSARHVSIAPLALPNISLPCSKCSANINICYLRSHRDFHNALQTFKFAADFIPQNLKFLLKRRKTLIAKLQETGKLTNGKGFSDKNLQKINIAFEILKSELEGTGNNYRVLETKLSKCLNEKSYLSTFV